MTFRLPVFRLPMCRLGLLTFRLPKFEFGLAWLPWKPLAFAAGGTPLAMAVETKICLSEGQ